jgi:hypothetical protein
MARKISARKPATILSVIFTVLNTDAHKPEPESKLKQTEQQPSTVAAVNRVTCTQHK